MHRYLQANALTSNEVRKNQIMSPLAPTKTTFSCLSGSSDSLSNSHSSTESVEISRKMYSINELMKMRNIDCQQPAKMFNTPIINEILRRDLDHMPELIMCPQLEMDFMKPHDNIQNRLRQFQRNRHSARSIDESHSRNGTYPSKRHNRHNNGESQIIRFDFDRGSFHSIRIFSFADNNVQINRASTSEIRIRLCIQENVKLHTAENAWTPSMFVDRKANQDAVDELFRQVRSILNKLTAQNFEVMLDQFKEVVIDSKEKLDGVINLVFNKAVNEPNFSVGYAHLCKHLSVCGDKIKSTVHDADFKRTFITKCQHEFEQHVANENAIAAALGPLNDKLKEATANKDEKKCAEIKCQIIEEEANVRRRLVSTVRFIGELYKLDMLTTKIMKWCITTLIDSGTDEKLECVCKLLTTIGEKLERKPDSDADASKKQYLDLSPYMKQLRQIIDRKSGKNKIGTRIK